MTEVDTLDAPLVDLGIEVAGMELPPMAQLPALSRPDAQSQFLPVPLEVIREVGALLHNMPGLSPHFGDLKVCEAVAYRAARWRVDPVFVAEQTYFTDRKGGGLVIGYMAQLLNAVILANAPFERRPRLVYGYGGDGKPTIQNRFVKVFFFMKGEAEPLVTTSPTIGQIKTKNSPLWFSDGDQQLAYYTVRSGARRYCPDVLAGVYTMDEVKAFVLSEGSPRGHSLFEEDEPPPQPIDAEFDTIPPQAPQKPQDGAQSDDGREYRPEPQKTQETTEPPPAGNLEPDDLPDIRAWAAGEQSAIMAMDDHVVATETWNRFVKDARWKRLRSYDQTSANVIKAAVLKHIEVRRNL